MFCIQEYGARTVGCHPSWDNYFGDFPNCTTLNQIKEHEELYELYYNADKYVIEGKTNCFAPCDFFEYSLVGEKQTFAHTDSTAFKISLSLVSTSHVVVAESLLYPFDSFVGEFGGALGLFIGASFLSVWDIIEYLASSMTKIKSGSSTSSMTKK